MTFPLTSRTLFVIEERWPIYGGRDEYVGTRGRVLPETYTTIRMALKRCQMLYRMHGEGGGDEYYEVLICTGSGKYVPLNRLQGPFPIATAADDDDMPCPF